MLLLLLLFLRQGSIEKWQNNCKMAKQTTYYIVPMDRACGKFEMIFHDELVLSRMIDQ